MYLRFWKLFSILLLPALSATAIPDSAGFEKLLKPIGGSMRLLECNYDGSVIVNTKEFSGGKLTLSDAEWISEVKYKPIPGNRDAMELVAKFRLRQGISGSAGIAVAFDFDGWSTENYVMIPASVYNGNRNRIVNRNYAAGLDRDDLYKKELPLTTTGLPQLSTDAGKPSKIMVTACNATTPAICIYSKKFGRAFILLADQGIRTANGIVDNGLIVSESADRTKATIMLSAPGVRELKPEFVGFSPSPDRGIDWKAGDEITMRIKIYSFKTTDIPGLLEKFMSVRKEVSGPNQPRNLMPFSEAAKVMARNIDNRYFDKGPFRFYRPENADWISFGWVGGLMDTYPMLVLGDSLHLDHAANTFDFAIPRAQGTAGYFYGALNFDGKCFGREGYDEFPWITLTRKNGDVLYWMIKQFELLREEGKSSSIKPAWETNIHRLAQAFSDTWNKYGQWGNFVNINTGEVAVYNTTSGASAVGGMALASDYFKEPGFMKVAMEAANYYYSRDFVANGMTTGACADILQNADSESASALMTSLMVLYELTGDQKWLDKSRNVANLFATWVVSYDYELPPQTELAKLGAKLTGAVWASTQNKHGAPGICTSSGDPLFKIFRATGDTRYAELIRDIAHAWAEGVQPDGTISERLTYCDADSRGSRGAGWKTGWNELNGILMAMELPGIYLQTDKEVLYVLDQVEVKIISRSSGAVKLEITNPTKYDAEISVFAESSTDASKPLGNLAFLKWPKISVSAGETKSFVKSF